MAVVVELPISINQDNLAYVLCGIIIIYALASKGASLITTKINVNHADAAEKSLDGETRTHRTLLYIAIMHTSVMALFVLGVLVLLWLKN